MEKQSIKRESLQKIWDVACPTWKAKLEGYLKRNLFSDSVELTQEEVNEMFEASNSNQVKVLLKYLKREKNAIDLFPSFDKACKALGVNPKDFTSAFDRLRIFIKAVNQGWTPDFKNGNQKKYYNVYSADNNGKPSLYGVLCSYVDWFFPSALYIKNPDIARHVAKVMDKEYKEYFLTM